MVGSDPILDPTPDDLTCDPICDPILHDPKYDPRYDPILCDPMHYISRVRDPMHSAWCVTIQNPTHCPTTHDLSYVIAPNPISSRLNPTTDPIYDPTDCLTDSSTHTADIQPSYRVHTGDVTKHLSYHELVLNDAISSNLPCWPIGSSVLMR